MANFFQTFPIIGTRHINYKTERVRRRKTHRNCAVWKDWKAIFYGRHFLCATGTTKPQPARIRQNSDVTNSNSNIWWVAFPWYWFLAVFRVAYDKWVYVYYTRNYTAIQLCWIEIEEYFSLFFFLIIFAPLFHFCVLSTQLGLQFEFIEFPFPAITDCDMVPITEVLVRIRYVIEGEKHWNRFKIWLAQEKSHQLLWIVCIEMSIFLPIRLPKLVLSTF